MACAAYTRSVAYSREGVNPRRPEKSQYRARREMMTRAARDGRLPSGAVRLLVELDNWGWRYGVAFPRQEGLALRLCVTARTIQRWTKALQDAGYIAKTVRTGRACRHTLAWAANVATGATEMSHQVGTVSPTSIGVEARSIEAAAPVPPAPPVEPSTPAAECSHCGGTGDRAYHVPAQIGAAGRRIPARSWRGKCGCGHEKAIMRECEKRGNSDA
jgi:hypothetical protein